MKNYTTVILQQVQWESSGSVVYWLTSVTSEQHRTILQPPQR